MEILIGAIVGLVTGLAGTYVALRMLPPNIAVAKSQEQKNLSDALKNAVDAMLATSADRNALETRLDELEAHREKRTKEMLHLQMQNDDLQAAQIATQRQIENLNREYTIELTKLREQLSNWEARYNEIKDKYHKVVEFFVGYLREKNEPIPPDLALLLGDSITKFKLKGSK
jgi:chromosome segregation ATPase